MINNFYTFRHLAAEWHRRSAGMAIAQPFSQVRNELILPFEPVDRSMGASAFVAVVSCEPTTNALFFRESYPRAHRNSADIFEGMEGALVGSVTMTPGDREIVIALRTGHSIVLQFFGSRSNALLVREDRLITAAFLHPRSVVNTVYAPRPELPASSVRETLERIAADSPRVTVPAALKQAHREFGNLLIREVLFRAGCDAATDVGSLSASASSSLEVIVAQLTAELTGPPHPLIYYREDEPVEFTVLPLKHLEGFRAEERPSISDAIRRFIGTAHQRAAFTRMKDHLLVELQRTLESLDTAEEKLRATLPTNDEADRLDRAARLLQIHAANITKGERSAIVEDLLSPGREIVSIDIDPFLSPAKNIQRAFDRAKKARTAIDEHARRLTAITKERRTLAEIIEDVDRSETQDELDTVTAHHHAALAGSGLSVGRRSNAGAAAQRPPFRIFTVDGGFQVWAGKSGENNDLLTTRHTAKNDLWFHVRGLGGSHVVLKVGTGRGEVSKRAKEQAAGIAAYYSKMRKATHVAVTMCEGKFVRKPKGAPTGTVTVERETVIFADPILPQSSEDDD